MNTLRRFVRQILGTILHLGFFMLLMLTIFKFAFENPATIKDSIARANTYQSFVVSIADSNRKQLKLSDQDTQNLRSIALQSFSPRTLQAQTEEMIDHFYAWLKGDKADFTFSVDLEENRAAFARSLSELVLDKLAFMPVCEKPPETIDPFTASCRPEQINYTAEKATLSDQLIRNPDFLGGLVFNEHNTVGKSGKTLSQQHPYAPLVFKVVRASPIILLLFVFSVGALYITLSKPKILGLRWLARDLCTSSATVLLAPIAFTFILPRFTSIFAPSNSASGTQAIFDSVLSLLTKEIYGITIQVAGAWFLGAGFLWLVLRLTKNMPGYGKPPLQSSEKQIIANKQKVSKRSVPIQSSEGEAGKTRRLLQKKYKKIPKALK